MKDLSYEADQLVLNVKQAQKLLGISRGLVYEAIRTGQLPSVRIGRRILIPRAKLNKMLEAFGEVKTDY